MKTKLLAGLLLAGSCLFAAPRLAIGVGVGVPVGGYYGGYYEGYYAPAPAPVYAAPAYVPPPAPVYAAPAPGYTWVDGYWYGAGPRRVWRAGYWAAPRAGVYLGARGRFRR